MPDILNRIREDQRLQDNRDLAQADSDARWDRSFSNIPSADVLRSRLNLADTVDRVVGNKLRLNAETDIKALRILEKQQQLNEWERQAPLREEKLIRQVESQGAAQRFAEQKDAEAMRDVAGFFEATRQIKSKVGTPEYADELSRAVQAHPRVIGTQVGADALKRMQQEHENIMSITPPAGHRVSRYEFSDDGKMKAITEPIPATPVIPPGVDVATVTVNPKGEMTTRYEQPKAATAQSSRELAIHQGALDRASSRRITAQKALDAARKTDNQEIINNNLDLVKAADAEIMEAKKQIQSLQGVPQPAASAPVNAPADAPPVLTDKSQFDALPSGSVYIRDGVRYQKP